MFDILSIIPGKKRQSQNGWITFNCPACVHLGHRPDTRYRGGVILDGNNFTFKCFNCHHKCTFTLGRSISHKCQQLLLWCGVDPDQIRQWSFESLRHRDVIDVIPKSIAKKIDFPVQSPPEGELLNYDNPHHQVYIQYLTNRGIDPKNYPFMVTPNAEGRYSQRVIIPFTHNGIIVGHTSRFLDNKTPKFINKMPPGYLFGTDLQRDIWSIVIVVEGIFDALSINGVATMHDDISEEQASIIAMLNRKVIYVPDRDKQGLEVIERALELGYNVSLPLWDDKCKDVNDAVVKYGKLPTLMSIIQSATSSKIKIDMSRRELAKRI